MARKLLCPTGCPRSGHPYPFEIIQAPPGQSRHHELSHQVRMIAMDKPLPSDEDLLVCRSSTALLGHFDGERWLWSRPLQGKYFVDARRRRNTDEMRTVERIRRISPNAARGRHHHPRSRLLLAGLAGTLRLHATQ